MFSLTIVFWKLKQIYIFAMYFAYSHTKIFADYVVIETPILGVMGNYGINAIYITLTIIFS